MSISDKNNFLNTYDQLPVTIRDLLVSDTLWLLITDALSLANSPTDDENIHPILDLITDILTGQLSYNDFENELEELDYLSDNEIRIIANVIKQKLFDPLKYELEELQTIAPLNSEKKDAPTIKPDINLIPVNTNSIINSIKIKTPEIVENKNESQLVPKIDSTRIIFNEINEKTTESFSEPQKISTEEVLNNNLNTPLNYSPTKSIDIKPLKQETVLNEVIENKNDAIIQQAQHNAMLKSKLWEVMQRKQSPHKISEEIKKIQLSQKKETKESNENKEKKPVIDKSISQLNYGETTAFVPEESTLPPQQKTDKPSILEINIKEEKLKEDDLSNAPVRYSKYEDKKIFGEKI